MCIYARDEQETEKQSRLPAHRSLRAILKFEKEKIRNVSFSSQTPALRSRG